MKFGINVCLKFFSYAFYFLANILFKDRFSFKFLGHWDPMPCEFGMWSAFFFQILAFLC